MDSLVELLGQYGIVESSDSEEDRDRNKVRESEIRETFDSFMTIYM